MGLIRDFMRKVLERTDVPVYVVVEPRHNIDYSWRLRMDRVPQVGEILTFANDEDPVYQEGLRVTRDESFFKADGSILFGMVYADPIATL